jgi:pimeloyl-ACP methyl ester carboxylesterase
MLLAYQIVIAIKYHTYKKESEMIAPREYTEMFNSPMLTEYLVDAGQRMVLYWDVMRQRGNQYLEHMAETVPHVLQFDFELVMDGRTLPKPVNYGLVKIKPPEGTIIDEYKRPFVVVDPRAGHGPGIGGFKPESQIGMAFKSGHPCYFIGFAPVPEPGQTLEDIMYAEAAFIKKVRQLHPKAEGKPVVIGNCQAGWAVALVAATHPQLCGPIILAGAPLSYWSGVRGENPMRYTGGLLGGSWLTALTSDLGNGIFDGAWLVSNFENLNPANTLWTKQYNVYAKVDREAARYLGFERWWGGHVLLNGGEIQSIVDELFVGNRLSTAQLQNSDGTRVDLRKIRTPIICLCSKGDNITPPQQALGWILDLYNDVDDIRVAGQTIVYAVHDKIGHLGIFVSGSVAKKEHQEFTSNIDLIDCLPPGLYEAVMLDRTENDVNPDLISGDYICRFEKRTLEDIRALGGNNQEDERCFAAVARLSEITHGLYRTAAQPLVRSMVTEEAAEGLRQMHPARLNFELFSDRNPAMQLVASAAKWVRDNRQPVDSANLFWQWQEFVSDYVIQSLDAFRDWRDMMMEQTFFGIYNQPWLQAMLGLKASDAPPRPKPGQDPDHIAFVERRIEELKDEMDQGGLREAAIRAMLYIRMPEGAADERGFEMLRRIRLEHASEVTLDEFKHILREQYFMLLIDEDRALATIPALLKGHEKEVPDCLEDIRKVVTAGGPLGENAAQRFKKVEKMFTPPKRTPRPRAKKSST